MLTQVYDIGDMVKVTGTFRDSDEVLVDPAGVECHVESPDGVVTSPTVTNPSVGVYDAIVEPDSAGDWWFAFDGEGGVQASEERRFVVRERQVPR